MLILTIRKGFKTFELKFEPLERDAQHSNANSNHSKVIQSIRIQIRTTWQGIRMQIRSYLRDFEAIEWKF